MPALQGRESVSLERAGRAQIHAEGHTALTSFLVNIDVDDLERAIQFYQTAFGLRVGRRLGAEIVEMSGGPAPIYLLLKDSGTVPTSCKTDTRRYDRHWTPVHLDFVVDDLESAVRRGLNAGARLEAPVTAFDWGKLAVMADPFGHGFCFVQFLGRGYDALNPPA